MTPQDAAALTLHRYIQEYVAGVTAAAMNLDPDALDRYIDRGNRSLSIGPFIDPTLFKDNHNALGEDLNLAVALRDFRRELVRLGVPDPHVKGEPES